MTASLLEVAREAFRKHGYKKTSVAQLTQAAGMATGSFYKYYASKEAIFIAVYDVENTEVRQRFMAALQESKGLVDGVLTLMDVVGTTTQSNQIVQAWYQPTIGPILHKHYAELISHGQYSFMADLQDWLNHQADELRLTDRQRDNLHNGVLFMNAVDQMFDEQTAAQQLEVYKMMVQAYLERWVLDGEEA